MILYIHSNSFIQSKALNLYKMLSSFSYNVISNVANLNIYVISNNESFISQKLEIVRPLGGKFDFSIFRDLKFEANLITEPQKPSSALSQL